MTTLMEYLLACNILDILTGFIKAYDQKNVSVFVPVPEKLKNILDTHTTQKETEKETVKTVDPDILKFIKEQDKK